MPVRLTLELRHRGEGLPEGPEIGAEPPREVLAERVDVAAADEPRLVPRAGDGVDDVVGVLEPGDDADGVGLERAGDGLDPRHGGDGGLHRGDALAARHLDHELERGGRDVLGIHLLGPGRVRARLEHRVARRQLAAGGGKAGGKATKRMEEGPRAGADGCAAGRARGDGGALGNRAPGGDARREARHRKRASEYGEEGGAVCRGWVRRAKKEAEASRRKPRHWISRPFRADLRHARGTSTRTRFARPNRTETSRNGRRRRLREPLRQVRAHRLQVRRPVPAALARTNRIMTHPSPVEGFFFLTPSPTPIAFAGRS